MLISALAVKSNISHDRCLMYLDYLAAIEQVQPINHTKQNDLVGITGNGVDFYESKLKYFVS